MSDISADEARTADIDYIGPATMEDWFADMVDLFERHGCKVEGSSDGPTSDSWYERLTRSEAEVERLSAENERKTKALVTLRQWDMLSTDAEGRGVATADAPWALGVIAAALSDERDKT